MRTLSLSSSSLTSKELLFPPEWRLPWEKLLDSTRNGWTESGFGRSNTMPWLESAPTWLALSMCPDSITC